MFAATALLGNVSFLMESALHRTKGLVYISENREQIHIQKKSNPGHDASPCRRLPHTAILVDKQPHFITCSDSSQ